MFCDQEVAVEPGIVTGARPHDAIRLVFEYRVTLSNVSSPLGDPLGIGTAVKPVGSLLSKIIFGNPHQGNFARFLHLPARTLNFRSVDVDIIVMCILVISAKLQEGRAEKSEGIRIRVLGEFHPCELPTESMIG
jgi:hypothetical protein